jgi:hypothetical protein
MTLTIVIFAAVSLLLILFRTVHEHAAQISSLNDLPCSTERIDLPAFLNLIDPEEERFLRENLTPKVFREVQRERLFASVEYVRRAAQNAGVLVRLGEAIATGANSEVSRQGRELATAAISLRALAILALCFMYARIAIPGVHPSLLQIPTRYECLVEQVARLARFQRLAQVTRILGARCRQGNRSKGV